MYSVPLNLLHAVWRYIFKKYFFVWKLSLSLSLSLSFSHSLSLSFSLFLYTPVNSQWFQTHGTGIIHTSTFLTKLINSFTLWNEAAIVCNLQHTCYYWYSLYVLHILNWISVDLCMQKLLLAWISFKFYLF